MAEDIRGATLTAIGLDERDLYSAREKCVLRLPEQADTPIEIYQRLLGPEAEVRALSEDEAGPFSPSKAHCFSLLLWPHLYWVVNRTSAGQSWGVGFQNQSRIKLSELEPDFIQPLLWTRDTVHAYSDNNRLFDGWEENVVEHFRFGSREYEGAFVFGLLQRWRHLL